MTKLLLECSDCRTSQEQAFSATAVQCLLWGSASVRLPCGHEATIKTNMNKYPRNHANCEKCCRTAYTTLLTLAPVNGNPPALWLCKKCKAAANTELQEWRRQQQEGIKPKPAPKLLRSSQTTASILSRRASIFAREQGCCAYCGGALEVDESTLDHVIPKSRGGGGGVSNLVLCCVDCNRLKGDRTPDEAELLRQNWPVGLTWKPAPFWQLAQVQERNHGRMKALRAGAGC